MFTLITKLALLFLVLPLASSITFQMTKNELFCTWKYVKEGHHFTGAYVISGYSEEKVSMMIYSPANKVVVKKDKGREGNWNFESQEEGEYRICFRSIDTKQKYITFTMQTDEKEEEKAAVTTENFVQIKSDFMTANSLLKKILLNQRFQKTRETIHRKNNQALLSGLNWSAFFKGLVLVCIAAAQMYVLTGFFRKRKFSVV